MSAPEKSDVQLDQIIDRAARAQPQDRFSRFRRVAVPLIAIVSLAALALASTNLVQARNDSTRNAEANGDAATVLADRVLQVCRTGGSSATLMRQRGLCTSATTTKRAVVPGKPGKPGSPGVPGSPGAAGSPGTNGVAGPAPSAAQIAAAVSAFCGVRTDCRGRVGASGSAGANGNDGQPGATGPPGPKGDTGATGPTGTAGTDGAPGRDAFPFTFTFVVPGAVGDTTYTCTVNAPGDPGTCTSS